MWDLNKVDEFAAFQMAIDICGRIRYNHFSKKEEFTKWTLTVIDVILNRRYLGIVCVDKNGRLCLLYVSGDTQQKKL